MPFGFVNRLLKTSLLFIFLVLSAMRFCACGVRIYLPIFMCAVFTFSISFLDLIKKPNMLILYHLLIA